MATPPRVGVFRKSMMINPRIIEAPLGKPRLRGFSIPGPDFTYGVAGEIHKSEKRGPHSFGQSALKPTRTRSQNSKDRILQSRCAIGRIKLLQYWLNWANVHSHSHLRGALPGRGSPNHVPASEGEGRGYNQKHKHCSGLVAECRHHIFDIHCV
ncbi:unnamed protein product [Knipowitschia caucasica]